MRRPEIRISIVAFMLLLLILIVLLATRPVEAEPLKAHVVRVPWVDEYRAPYVCMTVEPDPVMAQVVVKDPVIIQVRVTAYAPFDNQSGICAESTTPVTSRGHRPSRHYAAVDPSRIPYGTRLNVPGYGEVVAGDTGGALRSYDGYAIDVFFEKYTDAMEWGVRYLEVEVLE